MATGTLGTSEKASRWLQAPNMALDDQHPLDLLDTDLRARSVETILMRIEYGLYSWSISPVGVTRGRSSHGRFSQ
jgi:putative toxin-antitoxin system antitoxin component (TIGR02293 family)